MRCALGLLLALPMDRVHAKDLRGLGCTAMAVDGRASVDGSAYAGMNTDCSSCDPRVAWVPGGAHAEGARRPLYNFSGLAPRFVGYGRGAFYEPKAGQSLSGSMGSIPQVRETFGYWEGALPMMNEKGLTMGESSCPSRLMNYPVGGAPISGDPRFGRAATEGLVDLANLMQLAMERCTTARCAVETMGALSDKYGFYPMVGEWSLGVEADGKVAFDDGGEAITVADRLGEAWIFHIVGGVPSVGKSAWVAMRLPPGHAAFVANNFILREVPKAPSDSWLFSANLRDVARASGLWNGQEPLDFSKVFAPNVVTFQSPAGEAPIPLYAALRQWRLTKIAAPEVHRHTRLPIDPLELPVTVEVEHLLEHREVFSFLSDLYEGTEFDLTQGILAGPFGNPFRVEGGSATTTLGQIPRGIAIARTSYSVIGQSRPTQAGEAVMWFAADTPATSVYVPFYASAGGRMSPAYAEGTLLKFSRSSAFWAFDFVSNWASATNWRHASEHFLRPLRAQLQDELSVEMRHVEAKAEKEGLQLLADWQVQAQQRVVDRWWELADDLVVIYNDGFFNNATTGELGVSLGYPEWWARKIGFNQDIHPIFVKRDAEAQESFASDPKLCPPGWQPPKSSLPDGYNFAAAHWLFSGASGFSSRTVATPPAQRREGAWLEVLVQASVASLLLAVGVLAGRAWERRVAGARAVDGRVRPDPGRGYEPLL